LLLQFSRSQSVW